MSELCFAAAQGHVARVVQLLDSGRFSVDSVDGDAKQTALHHSAREGHVEVVSELLLRGADASARSATGKTALHHAAGGGHMLVVRKLLSVAHVDADALTWDERRWAALHFAVFGDHADVVELLFELGANVDVVGARDWTPLHQAAFLGRLACVKALLAAGASPQRVNAGGHVPYKLAKQQKHADCYKTLKPLTNKAVARDKSPRKVFGAVTVSRGLVAAADKQQLLRQPPPQQPHAPQRMQSAPAIQRAGAASAAAEWECPSCNYAHNTAALCAVCSVSRPSFLAPPTNPEPPRTPSPTGSLRGPRRLDSAVQEALARLELASYADVFVENEIDFGALLLLSESDLKDLGITALGPRRKLLAFIQDPSFQPFKPGAAAAAAGKSAPMSPAAAASQSAPPLLPGTMQAPMVPRELFQSSGQSMYERAPPPDAKFGDVTSTARERHALAHSGQSPYSELPALQAQRGASQPRGLQRPLAANADNPPYNPIPLVRPQADAGRDDDSGDSGSDSAGNAVYGVMPPVRRGAIDSDRN
jgi:ankyrin repeat protein